MDDIVIIQNNSIIIINKRENEKYFNIGNQSIKQSTNEKLKKID